MKKGFTLIELLVVIAIIGILSSVVLASLNTARERGRDGKRMSELKSMQLALELYYDENSSYPSVTDYASLDLTAGFYLASMPVDPGNSEYGYTSNGSTYCLSTYLEAVSVPSNNSSCTPEVTDPAANYKLSP